jgi:hypothetical protein
MKADTVGKQPGRADRSRTITVPVFLDGQLDLGSFGIVVSWCGEGAARGPSTGEQS